MVLVLLGLLVAAGGWAGSVQQTRVRDEARRFPRVGRPVAVETGEINAWALGQGQPVVVLDAGHGGSIHTWAWVQPRVAQSTRVVSFDRPGMGHSSAVPGLRTADVIAAELHALLRTMGEPPPYVLAGHSMGGFTVRAFADRYPDEVAGAVFVDASHAEEDARMAALGVEPGSLMRLLSVLRVAQPLGVTRWLEAVHLLPPLEILAPLPSAVAGRVRADFHRGPALDTYVREARDFPESARRVAAMGDLGTRPVVAVSRDLRGGVDPVDALARELQEDLARLSGRGRLVEVPQSTHDSIVTSKRHARVVADAIVGVVRDVRESAVVAGGVASR